MNARQRWNVWSGLAAELTVLAWSFFALDLPVEAVLVVGGGLALSLLVIQIVRPGWYGLALAWTILVVASQWSFVGYVSETLALPLAFALATLVIAVVSPGYHAARRALRRPEEAPRSHAEESRR